MPFTIIKVEKLPLEKVTTNNGTQYVRAAPGCWFIIAPDGKLISCASHNIDLELAYNKFISGYTPIIVLERRSQPNRRISESNAS